MIIFGCAVIKYFIKVNYILGFFCFYISVKLLETP
jgi:hypothetical protein